MHLLERRYIPWIIVPIIGLLLLAPLRAGAASLSITTTALADGEVGSAYSQTLAATGGTTPYAWSISAGTLPAGLSLNASTGVITGTPTTVGTSNFTARVTDASSTSVTAALSIVIHDNIAVTTTTLPAGTVGTAYSQLLAAGGGISPFTWSIAVGSLPAGLSLNSSTGAIAGTPTTAGTSNFTVQVTDSLGRSAVGALTLTINAASTTLAISTSSLPNGTVGTAYSQTLGATGGTAPYTWSISAGSLPAGLALNASTGAITGTPTTAGTANFTVMVTDSAAHTATSALSIVINATGTPTPSAEFPGLDHLSDQVQAACAAISSLPSAEQTLQTNLCNIFLNTPDLMPAVRNEVGHLILKVAGMMAKGEEEEAAEATATVSATTAVADVDNATGTPKPHGHDKGDDKSLSIPSVTPTPHGSTTGHGNSSFGHSKDDSQGNEH